MTPGIVWWQGEVACSHCGYGTDSHDVYSARSVIPIPAGRPTPPPMECPSCRKWTLQEK